MANLSLSEKLSRQEIPLRTISRNGEKPSLLECVRVLHPRLFRYLRWKGFDSQKAQTKVQQILAQVLKEESQEMDFARALVRSFLLATQLKEPPAYVLDLEHSNALGEAVSRWQKDTVAQEIRETWYLIDVEGFCLKETAAILETDEREIRQSLHQARLSIVDAWELA